jgi:hypothetical protein
MYTSSLMGAYRNVVSMSSWQSSRSRAAAMARKRRILAMRMTWENVSVESSPARWLHPLATNRALKRETSPAVSDLTLQIHMSLPTMRPGGRSTTSHVPLSMREEYSCCIAACH